VAELPVDRFQWVGTIETLSGQAFNVTDPDPTTFDINDIATALSHICRYNGHVPFFYSVAEHSVRVADWLRDNGHDRTVQLTGLLHDASEAYVGDMVRPLKRLPDLGALHQQIETRVAELLHARYGGLYPHPEAIHVADRGVYDWEVINIRSGRLPGWNPVHAYMTWLDRYEELTDDLT
jgi:uncharacterized protein